MLIMIMGLGSLRRRMASSTGTMTMALFSRKEQVEAVVYCRPISSAARRFAAFARDRFGRHD